MILRKKDKILSWQIFLFLILINFVVINVFVKTIHLMVASEDELECHKQMKLIQKAVIKYNLAHPEDKKLYMEFGFPKFIENVLMHQGYIEGKIENLHKKHSYYLERNGFVNCREHPRNPFSIYLMGLIILTILATVLELAFLGYKINTRHNPKN